MKEYHALTFSSGEAEAFVWVVLLFLQAAFAYLKCQGEILKYYMRLKTTLEDET
jgi:hypothetical protein